MMKLRNKIAAALLSLTLIAGTAAIAPLSVSAEAAEAAQTARSVSAEEIETYGAYGAIQSALDEARDNATDAAPYTVTVAPGSYSLNNTLHIYSNTTLVLNGVTLTRARDSINLLRVGDFETVTDGVTGYHYRNIALEGGVMDGANLLGTMLKMTHAQNFTMHNVAVKNSKNSHMIEAAGVDGFTVSGCTFTNQSLQKGETGFEAIQLDVLKSGNLVECRSEDLCMKNVRVENCVFTDCPRGVGSHTAVYNNPHTNIVIHGNTFRNMGSVAIQTLNWTNSEISANTITNAPRAIAVYTMMNEGEGTFLPSVFAKEGNTAAHFSDAYAAQKSNILIDGNAITGSGSVDDIYSSYEKAAISVIGSKVVKSTAYGNSGGSLPKGDYFCDTVNVRNNYIGVKGNGVRVEYAKNVNIDGNVILHSGGKGNANDYGVVFRNSVSASNIRKNYIAKSPVNGIWIDTGCAADNINNNEIYTAGKYGIGAYGATVKTVSNNDVQNPGREGIVFTENARLSNTIIGNRVLNAGEMGIHISANSSAAMIDKNLTQGCPEGIAYTRSAGKVTVGANYTASAALGSFTPDAKTVNLARKGSYRLAKTPNPLHAVSTYSFTSSDPSVAKVDSTTGRITGLKKGTVTVTMKSSNGKMAAVTVNVDGGAPQPVAEKPGAAALSVGNTAAGLKASWNKVANAVSYIVYYRPADVAAWSSAATDATSFVIPGAKSGVKYCVQVQTVGAEGVKGAYSKVKSMTYLDRVVITGIANSGGSAVLKWNAVGGANGYQIAKKPAGGTSYQYIDATAASYTDKNVSAGVTYVYQVRAKLATQSNGTAYGAYSAGKSVTVMEKPVLKLSNKSNGIRAEWNAVGASSYIVYYKKTGDSKWSSVETKNTYYPLLGITAGTNYSVQVQPVSGGAKGPYSSVAKLTYIPQVKPAVTLSNKSNGIRAEWKSIAGATRYTVYFKKTGESKWSSIQTANTYYPLLKINPGTNYSVQVQPVFNGANGLYSAVAKLTYQPTK